MKKLLLILCAVGMCLFISCKKDTTYTIIDKYGMPGASSYYIYLFEYDVSGGRVMAYDIKSPMVSHPYVFTANEHSEKVKVLLQFTYDTTKYNTWVQQIWYLDEGKNTDIVIKAETIIGDTEP